MSNTPRIALACALLASLGCSAALHPSESTAFVGVNLVPMDREEVLEDQTVVIVGDRIATVGPASRIETPAGATRIDGRGKFLMPGLADMHVHVWNEDHLLLFLANGVTTVRNMWGAPLHLGWQEQIAAGTLTAPTIYTTGPLMDGPGAFWPGSTILESPEQAAAEVRRLEAAGYRYLKVYNLLSKDVYQAIVSTAHELDMRVVGHVPDDVGLEGVLRAGQLSNEHLTGYAEATLADGSPIDPAWHGLPLPERLAKLGDVAMRLEAGELDLADVHDPAKIARLAQATAQAGMWNVPTLVVFKGMPAADTRRALEAPAMRYVDPATRQRWQPENIRYTAALSDEQLRAIQVFHEYRRGVVKTLHEAGARTLLGTDTPNPLVVPGFAIHEELRNLVACGLSPYEALSAGTVDAAEFVEGSDEWGHIAPGMRADLLLLEDDPLEDVANVEKLSGVMLRGRWLSASVLQARPDTLAARYADQEACIAAAMAGELETAWKLRDDYTAEHAGEALLDERELNGLGYGLLGRGNVAAAIEVFEINAQEHPDSGNVWDSLAEAYLAAGQPDKAIEFYTRALELDPANTNALQKLKQLRGEAGAR